MRPRLASQTNASQYTDDRTHNACRVRVRRVSIAFSFNQPLNDWNVSNVRDMSFMFSDLVSNSDSEKKNKKKIELN